MSLIKFGQYFGEVPNPTVGENLTIFAIDGFDDQTLYDYKKGDKLAFIFNPKNWTELLDHEIVTVEIQADTNRDEHANTIIRNCQTVRDYFNGKQNRIDNDFLELVEYWSVIWKKTYEGKQRHPGTDYKPYEIDFLTFSELEDLIDSREIRLTRKSNDWTRIYGEQLLDSKTTYRIMTVGGNVPDTCFLYDIHDPELYRSKIKDCFDKAVWDDEKQFWKKIMVE